MAQRKRIGLVFSYNESWIAGTYYILNIIHALKLFPKNSLPVLVLISEKKENFIWVQKETAYPFLEFFQYPFAPPQYSLPERFINKISWLLQRKMVIKKKPKQPRIDFLYPNEIEAFRVKNLKKVNWIPDFQEEYLSEYFSEIEIERRKAFQRDVVCKGDVVICSSEDSRKDFNTLYPNAEVPVKVLPFAVTHPNFNALDFETLRKHHRLPQQYFFVPNQFWAHKNHQVVLEALAILKSKGESVHIAFSGKETDYRNKDHFEKLTSYVAAHDLRAQVSFLGFLDRKVQLCLMKHAIAILQPSLFEGWSTVVEDAKALGKFLLLSHLPVHREQVQTNVQFFDPQNASELAACLIGFQKNIPQTTPLDYQENRRIFAEQFMKLVNSYS